MFTMTSAVQDEQESLNDDPDYNKMAQIHEIIPGLEYLNTIDQLIVNQKIDLAEALDCGMKRKYCMKNSTGEFVYYAIDETDCCYLPCLCPSKPFSNIKIFDYSENEVMHLNRLMHCNICCCLFERIEVYAPPGNLLGFVIQESEICRQILSIQTVEGETIFKVKGPFSLLICCSDIQFKVYDVNEGSHIGNITKKLLDFKNVDDFGVTFPLQLDVKNKALLVGALFLIGMFGRESGKEPGSAV